MCNGVRAGHFTHCPGCSQSGGRQVIIPYMAKRTILIEGDPALRKISREVTEINERIRELVSDMFETMEDANGVGLAAPQVGILRRIFVMNVGDGDVVAINPVLENPQGEQMETEGCLSLPGLLGVVKRPERVRLKAIDLDGKPFTLDLSGLGAICACHETDHLDGILYRDRAEGELFAANQPDDGDDAASGAGRRKGN
jgi:peptide deformylase